MMSVPRNYTRLFFLFSGALFLFFQSYHFYLIHQSRTYFAGFARTQLERACQEFEKSCLQHELFESALLNTQQSSQLARDYFESEVSRIEREYYLNSIQVRKTGEEALLLGVIPDKKDGSVHSLKRDYSLKEAIEVEFYFSLPFEGFTQLQQNALQAGFFFFVFVFSAGILLVKNLMDRSLQLQEEVESSQKLAEFGKISAGVAHDIRNPLSIIGLKVQELLELHEGDCETIDHLSQLKSAMGRINHTVGTLLVLQKENLPMDQEIDLKEILSSVIEDQQVTGFQIDFDVQEVKITGNRDILYRMSENLTRNALESGSGLPVHLRISGEHQEDRYKLSFADNGSGIEDLDSIYQPFFTTKNYGIGLGLMVVRDAVSRHSGEIECHSSKGNGTEFVIYFPASILS